MATHAQQNCTKFAPWPQEELKEQYQLTVLMAEQNFHQAIKIADRGYIIVHGRIEFEGRTAQELSENTLVKQYYFSG